MKQKKSKKVSGISSMREWLWLIVFFAALWVAGYLFYKYQPQELVEKVKTTAQTFWQRSERFFQETLERIKIESASQPVAPKNIQRPIEPPVLQPAKPVDFFEKGRKAFEAKDYKVAKESFLKSVSENLQTKESYYYLGVIALYDRQNQEALDLFSRGLELAPGHKDLLKGKATALFQLAAEAEATSRMEKAYEYLQACKEYYPNPAAWSLLWEKIAPSVEARKGIREFLKALEAYRTANQTFLMASNYELPNQEAGVTFQKAKTEFQNAEQALAATSSFLPAAIRDHFKSALRERFQSIQISQQLAASLPPDTDLKWQKNMEALNRANDAIRDAVVAFSEYLDTVQGIHADDLEDAHSKLDSNLKGILVTQKKKN